MNGEAEASLSYIEFSKPFKSIHTEDRGGGLPRDVSSSTSQQQQLYEFAQPIDIKHKKFANAHKSSFFSNTDNYNHTNKAPTAVATTPIGLKDYFSTASLPLKAQKLTSAATTTPSQLLEQTQQAQATPVPQQQRNHVVVVEQAPFSVFKSFKSQESIDKVKQKQKKRTGLGLKGLKLK